MLNKSIKKPYKIDLLPFAIVDLQNKYSSLTERRKNMSEEMSTFKIGDEIELGTWPFDRRGKVKKISWVIIDKYSDGTGLLLTKYGIETKQYNAKSGGVSWESCDLRKWLNSDFYDMAFTEDEKSGIMTVSLKTECKGGFFGSLFGKKTVSTKDNVFLINAEEAESLFGNESKRKAKATPWAIQNLAYADSESGACWWWLRSPGTKSDCAASVCDGTVNTEGLKIDYTSNSVRPAIKFNLNMYAQIIREQEEKAQ